jgi:triphosphoribosyl-dephospho-CoA synthase
MQAEGALPIGQCATLACLLEATIPKPGNVHRGADFEDMTFLDFVVAATALGPVMETAPRRGVGRTVLDAITAARRLVAPNTSLGTVLLIAPLAAVPREILLSDGIDAVLRSLTAEDASLVYQAIRAAHPGGMGRVDEMDVHDPPPENLLSAMQAAAERDLVARQYVNGFHDVLGLAASTITERCHGGWTFSQAVIYAHLHLMATYPDSLIARKCGVETACRAAALAAGVLEAGEPGTEAYEGALSDLDFWLRCDGHRRNPGTTADLVAAGIFVVLREARVPPPWT